MDLGSIVLSYPRSPAPAGVLIAREVMGKRFLADHKDYNSLLARLRAENLDISFGFYGECSRDAIPVTNAVADQNLLLASTKAIERKVASLRSKIGASVERSKARVDITRLGGSGAAGRQRDQYRDSVGRNITHGVIHRLTDELVRRQELTQHATTSKDHL